MIFSAGGSAPAEKITRMFFPLFSFPGAPGKGSQSPNDNNNTNNHREMLLRFSSLQGGKWKWPLCSDGGILRVIHSGVFGFPFPCYVISQSKDVVSAGDVITISLTLLVVLVELLVVVVVLELEEVVVEGGRYGTPLKMQ